MTASGEWQPPQPLPQANSLAAGFPVPLSGSAHSVGPAGPLSQLCQQEGQGMQHLSPGGETMLAKNWN